MLLKVNRNVSFFKVETGRFSTFYQLVNLPNIPNDYCYIMIWQYPFPVPSVPPIPSDDRCRSSPDWFSSSNRPPSDARGRDASGWRLYGVAAVRGKPSSRGTCRRCLPGGWLRRSCLPHRVACCAGAQS